MTTVARIAAVIVLGLAIGLTLFVVGVLVMELFDGYNYGGGA